MDTPSRCFLEGLGTRKEEVGVTDLFLCYFPWSTCTELDCLTESMADPSASQADSLTTAQVSPQSFTAVTVELILVFNTSRL